MYVQVSSTIKKKNKLAECSFNYKNRISSRVKLPNVASNKQKIRRISQVIICVIRIRHKGERILSTLIQTPVTSDTAADNIVTN